MATLDDSVLDNLRELNALRDRTKQLRERGRKALSGIPTTKLDYEKLARDCDLSNDQWVSGPHPIDLALLVRVLNHRDLGDYEYSAPDQLTETLAAAVERRFPEDKDDLVPILTAARAMHALIGTPQTVFSKATMLCYYRIVRELYLATFPNWIIGAARAGEGGRVSAFVTGECVRAILAFRDAIGNTITFLSTAKRLFEEHERLQHMPNVDDYLQMRSRRNNSHWKRSLEIEYERLALDWYAANNLRRNVIALDLSGRKKKHPGGDTKDTTHSIESLLPAFFPLNGERRIGSRAIRQALDRLPKLLMVAIKRGQKNITAAISSINKFRETERTGKTDSDRFRATVSAHDLALKVITEAFYEANDAARAVKKFEKHHNLPDLLEGLIEQHQRIHDRIHRAIAPSKRYIQDVLNRELAQVANSAKFDAGELLFAATCFGALNEWKQNEQVAEARRLLSDLLPEDGRLQTSRPFQSTPHGLRLIPIAFEMTRCFAQLMQKPFGEDLDAKVVRKILNAFEEHPVALSPGNNERIGWNFSGAPESQKPSVWVTSIAVFALDRTVRMLNERINAMVLRHFNVDWPSPEAKSLVTTKSAVDGQLGLNELMYGDYELQSAFTQGKDYQEEYKKDPHRVDQTSVAIRLQQMRAHLTRGLLPYLYSRKSTVSKYKKAYSVIFYGPPGTGKTTLAEALATTAKVPLVRLSPSDLMVQGTDVIESRARAIFDALSMLTQAVIFLDEFEPVVRTRESSKTQEGGPADPPEFRFLVTGMLPKLIKLNKAAETQSVVYCLATNYLVQIDDAAKRIGRFDLQIPIYHPDPMSRVGVFLYRLITKLQQDDSRNWEAKLERWTSNPVFWDRVHEAIVKTEEVSAQSLATIFFSTKASKSFFNYVLGQSACPQPTPEKANGDKTPVEKDIEDQRTQYENSWKTRSRKGN